MKLNSCEGQNKADEKPTLPSPSLPDNLLPRDMRGGKWAGHECSAPVNLDVSRANGYERLIYRVVLGET